MRQAPRWWASTVTTIAVVTARLAHTPHSHGWTPPGMVAATTATRLARVQTSRALLGVLTCCSFRCLDGGAELLLTLKVFSQARSVRPTTLTGIPSVIPFGTPVYGIETV